MAIRSSETGISCASVNASNGVMVAVREGVGEGHCGRLVAVAKSAGAANSKIEPPPRVASKIHARFFGYRGVLGMFSQNLLDIYAP